ncbi:hypothetical protein R4M05_07055 [Brachyspira intermedia]
MGKHKIDIVDIIGFIGLIILGIIFVAICVLVIWFHVKLIELLFLIVNKIFLYLNA